MCVDVVLEIWNGPKKVCAHRCLDNSDAKCNHTLARCEYRICHILQVLVCPHSNIMGMTTSVSMVLEIVSSEVKSLILGGMSDCSARFWERVVVAR
eukprot:SAG31_NODE_146_length_22601_cov_56.529192_3_plen_96_part_00